MNKEVAAADPLGSITR